MKSVIAVSPRFSRGSLACLIVAASLAVVGCQGSSDETPKHKIGGTVSGLAGSGLTVRSSGGEVLPISANGAFAFPTPAEEGTAYAVTITQQPSSPWQTCSIAGGSGTVGGADVASVVVTCTTNTYAIGGVVNGLVAGGTLVLQNNGGDDVTVTADGAFTFPSSPPSGSAYAVTVLSMPASQTCVVAGGTGSIAGAAVTSIEVACVTGAFAVGGTVSGLAGGGTLVLQNNLGDDLTILADGTYAFPTPVLSGGVYAVTVLSKPPSQACVVSNGSGTVGTSAVTNVNVVCSADTFAVGGTVSGLAGGGTLVLQNNGGDDKTITADGVYAFATPVPSGGAYAVTVLSKPASQTCTVSNGSGTVATSPVTDANVSCAVSTFTVGGAVVGLAGTGLVLHSDVGAGEDLTVAANATTFAFTTKAPSGSTVTVTVKTQPSSPAESCTVAGSPVVVGTADVASLTVSCTTAIQRWEAPTTWGGLWPDSPTMVQHAHFDGTQIVETKGVTWSVAGGPAPARRELTGLPGGSRWGAGPFTASRYQATGGDSGLDFPADMLACAVVKPDYNAVENGNEHVIMAKGVQDQAGWMLVQRHHMFNFYYLYDDGPSLRVGNAYTPTFFADASKVDNGPLNPSYVVVCGGRTGDTLVAAANSYPDASLFHDTVSVPGAPLHAGATPHRLTIGAYDDGTHPYRGRVYETAVWDEPATEANIQKKFNAILGLPDGAHYTRNREAPFFGPDGKYHTAWRHAPRAYLPAPGSDFGGGFLFGLQAWNRLTRLYTPPPADSTPQVNPVEAYGEALELWTAAGGASVQANQLAPPGDSEQNGAERVTLPAGGAISTQLGLFDSAGPIHGMMWIQPVSSAGTLRVSTTQAASGASQHDIDLAALPTGQWTRVWLSGLSNDGSQATPAVLSLTNVGTASIDIYAWGIDLTQIGRGGDLGLFDPGLEMYDWGGSFDNGNATVDVLQLAKVPSSTAATGFCLSVEAQLPAGLAWTAPFVADRSPLTWVSDSGPGVVNIFLSGTGKALPAGNLCAFVSTAPTSAICWAPTWAPGSRHTAAFCATPDGAATLYADGVAVGTPIPPGNPPPDLSTGHVLVGGSRGVPGSSTWQGFVTRAAVCPAGNLTACR
jgi:hypothetical protein